MKNFTIALTAALTIFAGSNAAATSMKMIETPNLKMQSSPASLSASEILHRFAATTAFEDLFLIREHAKFGSSNLSFDLSSRPARFDEIGVTIDGGHMFLFARIDGGMLPEIFLNPVSPTGPTPADEDNVLENPLPAAAPLLFAGLASLGLFSRRKRGVQN